LAAVGVVTMALLIAKPAFAASNVWRYTLLPDSQLIDDCTICGRPTIPIPMRGTFELQWVDENPLFNTYIVTNIDFEAATGANTYKVSGRGSYQFGGEVALRQEMFLTTTVDDGTTNRVCYFTNDSPVVERRWPMLRVALTQTNGGIQLFRMEIAAAPVVEIWFSTANSFHAGIWQAPTNFVSAGDFLSSAGRVVKRNRDLTARLGIMPAVPDIGLDAADVLPGGEIAWSAEQDIWSETLGQIHHGDLLSNRGRVLRSFAEFSGAFGPEPPPADQGLDAVQVLSGGETYFSVEQDFFSERLGRMIRRGDLLSTSGQIIKSNEQLVARFQPTNPKQDYGLDAIYVWPGGEVWFSVETGFTGASFQPFNSGDLLSDSGYVVYRNLDLLREFAPIEDLADFGLDALFVVTEAVPPAPAPRLGPLRLPPANGGVTLTWEGEGRVFQLERATNVIGPFVPVSAPMPDTQFEDANVWAQTPRAFYRVRQW